MTYLTVGAGGDYADWRDAYVWLRTVAPLGDDYEFKQISDCTINNNWPAFGPATDIDLNGYTVKFYCPWKNSHQGDPTRGFVTYVNGAAGFIRMVAQNGPLWIGNWDNRAFIAEGLYIRQTTNDDVTLLAQREFLQSSCLTVYARNILIRGFANNISTGYSSITPRCTRVYCSNMKIWNCKNGYSMQSSGGVATLLYHYFEISSIYNCDVALYTGGTQGSLSDTFILTNVFMQSNLGLDNIPRTMMYNCGCVGTVITASNALEKSSCVENAVAANEFQSLDDTSPNFLKLIDGTIT